MAKTDYKLAPWERQLNKEQRQAAEALGITNVNKQSELTRINNYVAAAQQSKSDPVYQQIARNLGITNYNSVKDYAQVVNQMTSAPAPQQPQPTPQQPSMINLSQFIGGTGSTQGTLGLNAINRARQQGLTDAQILQYASQQGLGFGAAARDALRISQPTQTTTPTPSFNPTPTPQPQFDFNSVLQQMQINTQNQLAQMQQQFQQQQAEAEAARQEQMRQMQEAQRTYAVNQARASAAGNLQIEGAAPGQEIGGTEGFKIRPQRGRLFGGSPIKLASTLNI